MGDEYSNCDPIDYGDPFIAKYVLDKWGDRCATPSIIKPTVIIYLTILVLGVVGNTCTCIVIARNKSLQNPTNYYLFSLAVSDLLMLVLGLPVELYDILSVHYPYRFGEFVCKSRAFLIEFTSYASILTITSFSMERWLAICFPIRSKVFSTFHRAVKMIVGVWAGAFIAALPILFIVVINRIRLPEPIKSEWLRPQITRDNITIRATEMCALSTDNPDAQRTFILSAFFMFFLLPALVISFVYFHIMLKIRCSDNYLAVEQQKINRSRKSTLRILVAVVLMFFVCWFPFHVQRLIAIYVEHTKMEPGPQMGTLYYLAFYLSGYFYYSNSACNPILYNILSSKYRRAFCKTILWKSLAEKCYKSGNNASTYSKNRNSLSRHSQTMRTRSFTRSENTSAKKKHSVDSLIPPNSHSDRSASIAAPSTTAQSGASSANPTPVKTIYRGSSLMVDNAKN